MCVFGDSYGALWPLWKDYDFPARSSLSKPASPVYLSLEFHWKGEGLGAPDSYYIAAFWREVTFIQSSQMVHEVQGASEVMGGRSHEVLRGTHRKREEVSPIGLCDAYWCGGKQRVWEVTCGLRLQRAWVGQSRGCLSVLEEKPMLRACTGKQRSAEKSACSEEAKERGCQSGLPLGEAWEGVLVVFSGLMWSSVLECLLT